MEKHLEFINTVLKNNKFYHELYKKMKYPIDRCEFNLLPTLSKEEIQKNISDLVQIDSIKNLETMETSGTTGLPLKIYWKKSEYIRSNYYTWYLRKHWYNITPNMKYCTFHSCIMKFDDFEIVDAVMLNNDRTLSLGRYFYTDKIIEKYISMINDFGAQWILGPISVLQVLSSYMIKNNKHLDNIVYIELNGEFVDNESLQKIREAFPRAQISNLYGSTEFNGIAFSCPCGNMHIISQNVYVESITNKEQIPCLYITGLINSIMPLIRYEIGDSGEIKNINCPCGNKNPILQLYSGRVNELIDLKNNVKLDPAAFNNVINKLNFEKTLILKYQIKILSNNKIELILLTQEKYLEKSKASKIKILNELKKINNMIDYVITFVSNEKDMLNSNRKFKLISYV